MIKRLITVLLCLCFVFFSVPVSGDVVEDFAVRVLEGEEASYTYKDGVLAFTSDGAYEVSMAEGVDVSNHRIVIASGVDALLTIIDLNLYREDSYNLISIANDAACDLILGGANVLETLLTATAVIHVPETAQLTIDGEGSLDVVNSDATGAAIGSNADGICGGIAINGGAVTAKSTYGAGIGSGQSGNSGAITISGGTVTAESRYGAGIGSGQGGYCGTIIIEGGDVSVSSYSGAGIGSGDDGTGGTVIIKGGTISTNVSLGAGIGSGNYGSFENITIDDGYINACSIWGAGIGGGYLGDCCDIVIHNGTITASSEGGAGIGGGRDRPGDNITINNGTISASSIEGAGIGGGRVGNAGDIAINGGHIVSISKSGAGIGGGLYRNGGTISITGGTMSAKSTGQGAGIGGGYVGNGGNIYISGGSVIASAASTTAETIGHGEPYSEQSLDSGVLLDRTEGSPVYLTVFDTGFGEAVDLSDGDLVCGGAAAGYGTGSLITDEDGKLYFYLPAGLAAARFSDNTYIADVQPTGVNSFQLKPEFTTAAGTRISTLPYFNAAAVSYTNPRFSAGANEVLLTTSVSGTLPILLAKMDNTVYPEPVTLTASILDASSQSGIDTIEAIDGSIASALTETAPDPSILAKAEQLLVLDLVLSLVSDDSVVQPVSGYVTISLPVPEGYDPAKIMLAHRKSDGTIEFLDIAIEDGWITFSTDSFSNYIVLELDMPLAEFMPPPPPDDQGEICGDSDGTASDVNGAGDAVAPPSDNDDKSAGAGTVDRAEDDESSDGSGQPADGTLPADAEQLPKTGEHYMPLVSGMVFWGLAATLAAAILLRKKLIGEK